MSMRYGIGLLLLLAASHIACADYWPQDDPRSGGMRDVMLLYVGDQGHYSQADLMPYVAYLDKAKGGKPQDWFYDSYLFLMFSGGPSGVGYSDGLTNLKDWQYYIDTLFQPGLNLAALDAAVSEAAKTLGAPARKVPIILMMPYIHPGQKVFGDPDGSGKVLDFSNMDDARRAATWLVEETSRRFAAAGYQNLSLWGYYWMNEGIGPRDEAYVKMTAQVVHERKFGFHWIPWFNAPGVPKWRELGFDFTVMQPNYAFMPLPRDEQRLADAAAICRKYDMGIEMEVAYRANDETADRDNLSDYLNYGLPGVEGYMSAVHGYYQGLQDIGRLYASDLPANNRLYRDLYLFHKGKYVRRDRSVVTGLPCEVRMTGKPPLHTTALTTWGRDRGEVKVSGAANIRVDLPSPLRIEEVRLHLRRPGKDVESLFFARAYAEFGPAGLGEIIGEAPTSQASDESGRGATLLLRGRPQLGSSVCVTLSGPPGAEAILDGLRVFAAGGTTPVGKCASDGLGNAGLLTDGVYASSPTDTANLIRWPQGSGSVTLETPPDRYLPRVWLHAVKTPGGQFPARATVSAVGQSREGRISTSSGWSGYLPVDLQGLRASKLQITLEGAGKREIALDEIEVEPATNLALGKPYTLEPAKKAQYPDDGRKLTDGVLSTGFGDGKTVGWYGTRTSVIVDLGQARKVDKVRVHVEGGGAGAVYLPRSITLSTSTDGQSWTPVLRRIVPPAEPVGEQETIMQWLEGAVDAVAARYVKLDFIPNAWLMVDEVEVLSNGENVALGCPYRLLAAPTSAEKYGDDGRKLTDGEVSEGQWNADRVVGYLDVDPSVTVDLLSPQKLGLVAAHVCGGGPAGIWYPEEMSVQTSEDGVAWSDPVATREHPAETGNEATVALMETPVSGTARYVRLHFKRRGWCMVDEVEVYGADAVRGGGR
jgi:hypothetical protein